MNTNSKLRYIIDLYGNKIWIPDMYNLYKGKVLKVISAKELSENNKLEIIESFKFWIKEVDEGGISKHDAKIKMLDVFINSK